MWVTPLYRPVQGSPGLGRAHMVVQVGNRSHPDAEQPGGLAFDSKHALRMRALAGRVALRATRRCGWKMAESDFGMLGRKKVSNLSMPSRFIDS